MMKRSLLVIMLLFIAVNVSGQLADSTFKLTGHVTNPYNGIIFMSYMHGDKYLADSTHIVDGKFEFTGKIPEPVVGTLATSKSVEAPQLYVYLEPATINMELAIKPFSIVKIAGSRTEDELLEWKDAFTKLKQKYAWVLAYDETGKDTLKRTHFEDSLVLYNDEKSALNYNFIKNHPQSYFTYELLRIRYLDYTIPQLNEIYNNMGSKLQANDIGKEFLSHINNMEVNSKGTLAANIKSRDYINNSNFDLSALKGKYVIIDFWGSWCKPCIALIPAIVEEHNKYKDKNIAYISVAYDYNGNQDKCRDMVNKLGMNWTNLWQSQDKRDPNGITSVYNVGVFPTIILIGPDGRIIERGEGEYGFLKCKAQLEKLLGL